MTHIEENFSPCVNMIEFVTLPVSRRLEVLRAAADFAVEAWQRQGSTGARMVYLDEAISIVLRHPEWLT